MVNLLDHPKQSDTDALKTSSKKNNSKNNWSNWSKRMKNFITDSSKAVEGETENIGFDKEIPKKDIY